MKTSDRGAALIERFEGFSATPYRCPAGKNTIGIGHLIQKGEAFYSITREQAQALLRADLKAAEDAVKRLVTVDLTQNEFDALVSFTFNLGAERLKGSTLLKLLNRGDYGGASKEFGKWVYVGSTPVQGLKSRRRAEAELFLTP